MPHIVRAHIASWEQITQTMEEAKVINCWECEGLGYLPSDINAMMFCKCLRGQALKLVILQCSWISGA